MNFALAPQFVRQYRQLSETDRQFCDAAVDALPGAFGYPHRHSGLSIRVLRRDVYECRASQAVRIGFTQHGDTLLLHVVGSHDTMRAWLRNNA
jgi:hypothetical protein